MTIDYSPDNPEGWPRIVRAALLYVVVANVFFLASQVGYTLLATMQMKVMVSIGLSVIAALDLLARPAAVVTAILCLRGNLRARRWLVWALVAMAIEPLLTSIAFMINVQRSNPLDWIQSMLNVISQTFSMVNRLLIPAGLAWFFSRPVVIGAMRAMPLRR